MKIVVPNSKKGILIDIDIKEIIKSLNKECLEKLVLKED